MTLVAVATSMVISPDDFDPPLKRIEATVTGYWTVEELATELEISIRTVQYLIKGGYPKKIDPAHLKAYKVGPILLVPDTEALNYLWKRRQSQKKS